ncbi:putative defense protein 2 [Patiria miniata]|uniref:Reelin domain-containing protein n=1 Tax=Patiria miniata TaxID=46514 RepID=A0A913ZG56_PATMI|nr:putative defense protein 2 [Patiria miniata]XP_038050414.1 putative defense protein 2 [Patiria miniata]
MTQLAIALLCLVPAVLCYTNGPPVSSNADLCTDMLPDGHNGGVSLASDQANPPYTITTSATEYAAGGAVQVTITGSASDQFKGFFIQARRADPARNNDVAIGTFSRIPGNTQLLVCHNVANSAWGHSNSEARTSATATWTAPGLDEGPVEFRATIVKGEPNRNYFYLNVKSSKLNFTNEAPPVSDGTTSSPSNGVGHIVNDAVTTISVVMAVFVHSRFY